MTGWGAWDSHCSCLQNDRGLTRTLPCTQTHTHTRLSVLKAAGNHLCLCWVTPLLL